MPLSIQTNIASLIAQNNIRINNNLENDTISQLSSGYRISSSADDAAGLAVANEYAARIAQLTQGVLNANNAIGQLQIVDGGLNNISQILDRLQTLATESASSTFVGNRTTLNNEYQGLLEEIDRQAANINLNTGGSCNTVLVTYTGGGANAADAQVSIDLSGANNTVDSAGLGIASTSIQGGGSELALGNVPNSVNLGNTATTFLAGGTQDFTFHIGTSAGNQDVTIPISGGVSGLTGGAVINALNTQLSTFGITASIAADGTLQFSGVTPFSVSVAAASAGNPVAGANDSAINTGDFNLDNSTAPGGPFAGFAANGGTAASETVVFQNAAGTETVTLNDTNASDLNAALATLNADLNGMGIYAVKAANGTDISFQSANSFSVNETAYTAPANGGTGNLFGGVGAVSVTAPAASASSTGGAIAALALLNTAISNLGLTQGNVGAGINRLNYAVNLAQSQITNYSAAESGIRDADIAEEAANLTKAQVLEQASLAALSQANTAPQYVLTLLQK
ncbi:MAG TPA: flagellin [Bryobacteraceae bacterium]|nr:flagellin [Bryobacteraceae bacterium]